MPESTTDICGHCGHQRQMHYSNGGWRGCVAPRIETNCACAGFEPEPTAAELATTPEAIAEAQAPEPIRGVPLSEFGGLHPELAARLTAAKAIVADFKRERNQWIAEGTGGMPNFIHYAERFAAELDGITATIERLA